MDAVTKTTTEAGTKTTVEVAAAAEAGGVAAATSEITDKRVSYSTL